MNSKLRQVAFALTVAAGISVVSGLILFTWCDPCGNEVVAEFPSPDGAKKVVIFQRDCGATTGFSTQASVLAMGEKKPSGSGNLFVADTDHGAAPAAAWGGPALIVRWENSRALTLEYDRRARVFHSERTIGNIEVRYVATD